MLDFMSICFVIILLTKFFFKKKNNILQLIGVHNHYRKFEKLSHEA